MKQLFDAFLKENDAYEKFYSNVSERRVKVYLKGSTTQFIIDDLLHWIDMEEGEDFWAEMYHKWIERYVAITNVNNIIGHNERFL